MSARVDLLDAWGELERVVPGARSNPRTWAALKAQVEEAIRDDQREIDGVLLVGDGRSLEALATELLAAKAERALSDARLAALSQAADTLVRLARSKRLMSGQVVLREDDFRPLRAALAEAEGRAALSSHELETGDCVECGNDADAHPLPWLASLNGPPTITFVEEHGGRWHHFVAPRQPAPSPKAHDLACREWCAENNVPDNDWRTRAGFIAGFERARAQSDARLAALGDDVIEVLERWTDGGCYNVNRDGDEPCGHCEQCALKALLGRVQRALAEAEGRAALSSLEPESDHRDHAGPTGPATASTATGERQRSGGE